MCQHAPRRTGAWIDAVATLRVPCEKFAAAVCLCRTDQAGRPRPRRDQRRCIVVGRLRQEFAHRPQHPARKLCGRERQRCIGSWHRRQCADRRLSPDHRPATAVGRASDRVQPRGGGRNPHAGLSRKEVIQAFTMSIREVGNTPILLPRVSSDVGVAGSQLLSHAWLLYPLRPVQRGA